MAHKRARAHQRLLAGVDENPLTGVANLFDVAMVFAVALLMALIVRLPTMAILSADEEITILRNPGSRTWKSSTAMRKHSSTTESATTIDGPRRAIGRRLSTGQWRGSLRPHAVKMPTVSLSPLIFHGYFPDISMVIA